MNKLGVVEAFCGIDFGRNQNNNYAWLKFHVWSISWLMVQWRTDTTIQARANGSWLCGIQYVPTPVSPSELMDHESLLMFVT
jgi:hypothetical protein